MSTLAKRHKTIIDLLRQAGGRLSVASLSEQLAVSPVTIRKDLHMLAEEHIIERVYGGAVLRVTGLRSAELAFEVRLQEARAAKNAVARAAAQLVKDGYGIALDGSTSVYAMMPYLKPLQNLTIVTNSLPIAEGFRDTPHNKVLVPGGRVRGESATLVGMPNALPNINLNYGFFGAWGVSVAGGASDIDPDEVQMRLAMIERCLQVIVLIDGRKWGEVAPYTYARLERIDRVITSEDAPLHQVELVRGWGVQVDLVPVQRA